MPGLWEALPRGREYLCGQTLEGGWGQVSSRTQEGQELLATEGVLLATKARRPG